MQISWLQLSLGVLLAIIIAAGSLRVGFLSTSGAMAAAVLGFIVFGLGGLPWAILLLTFFISSSGLSKFLDRRKKALSEKFAKGSRRDMGQVIANGGMAAIFVILHLFFPAQGWCWLGFAGSLAAVNADTWATELGVLSNRATIHILSGRRVEKGTSGGISLLGTLASVAGAALIAVAAILLMPGEIIISNSNEWWLPLLAISLAGLSGSLVDSLIGATIQTIYFCPQCQKETERTPEHTCGSATQYQRGWRWMNNDWVNFFCALTGSLVMVVVSLWYVI